MSFQISFRIRQLGALGLKEMLVIIVPLFGYLFWRSVQQFQGRRAQSSADEDIAAITPSIQNGLDSELYQIEQRLAEQDLQRWPAESWEQWRERLHEKIAEPYWLTFSDILALHYRYRFDPQGLSAAQRQQLRQLSQAWLVKFQSSEGRPSAVQSPEVRPSQKNQP